MEIITKNAKETHDVGYKMGSSLRGSEVILLKGELGAGKTTFVQGLSKSLGIENTVTSPTFILMRSYILPEKKGRTAKTLYHVDLYRLEQEVDREAQNLGIFDMWGRNDSIFVIEWADRLQKSLKEVVEVSLEVLDVDTRKITVRPRQL